MTHDPLCPSGDPRVQAAVAEAMQAIGAEWSESSYRCEFCPVIARVRDELRVKATRLYDDFKTSVAKAAVADADEVYDSALRDAAKAVEALHTEWYADGPDHVCDSQGEHDLLVRAVAAIEALGGEQ